MHYFTYIKCFWYFLTSQDKFSTHKGYLKGFDVIQIPELRTHHPYYLFLTSLLTIQETHIFLGLRNIHYHITPAENLKSVLLFVISTGVCCVYTCWTCSTCQLLMCLEVWTPVVISRGSLDGASLRGMASGK